jgi:uncharacterized membrane protein YoaK (UPF0700 family)
MSGNSVAIGLHFALRDRLAVLERLLPVGCYAVALVVTRIARHVSESMGFRGFPAATITRFNGVTVHTAFVTGSLVRLAESLAEWMILGLKGCSEAVQKGRDAAWFLGVWVAYVAGGACALLTALAIPGLIRPAAIRPVH